MREILEMYWRVCSAIWENTVTVETDSETWSEEMESKNTRSTREFMFFKNIY